MSRRSWLRASWTRVRIRRRRLVLSIDGVDQRSELRGVRLRQAVDRLRQAKEVGRDLVLSGRDRIGRVVHRASPGGLLRPPSKALLVPRSFQTNAPLLQSIVMKRVNVQQAIGDSSRAATLPVAETPRLDLAPVRKD